MVLHRLLELEFRIWMENPKFYNSFKMGSIYDVFLLALISPPLTCLLCILPVTSLSYMSCQTEAS